jgi:chromosome segregation ATPase
MFNAKSKRKGKQPSAVHPRSASSVISDLSSNPSESDSEEQNEISIPEAIEESPLSEEKSSGHTREVKDSGKSKSEKSKKSKKKSKKAEKSKDDSGGESSSTKSGVSKKRKKKKKKKEQLEDLRESEEEDMFEENEALQEEVLSLRRKLNNRGDAMEMIQLQMDLKRAVNEASELKSEIDEYEEAVAEKDGLIKKLTEAVDCQLDKVEYLELKLQRAEDEFVKMEGSFFLGELCYLLLNSTRRAYTYLIFCASSRSLPL